LVDALESLVSAHPDTTFIGAHVGCYAEHLGWVDRMLATYPNFWIDLSGRIAEIGRQPRTAARLILAHRDRVLFGTDVFPVSEADYAIWFRTLETDDEYFSYGTSSPPANGRWQISGLALPDDVLLTVYAQNARRMLEQCRRS
jgi:predicted TIM-barrel fold metal-dependent hydrolase